MWRTPCGRDWDLLSEIVAVRAGGGEGSIWGGGCGGRGGGGGVATGGEGGDVEAFDGGEFSVLLPTPLLGW